jgi:hypothetical protein
MVALMVIAWLQAAGLPAHPPEPQAPAVENGVGDALQRYAAALRSLDASAVKKVQPSIDVDTLKRAFREMRTLEVSIDEVTILSADGAGARVSCRVTQTVTPRGGRKQSVIVVRVIRLRPERDAWVIESFER